MRVVSTRSWRVCELKKDTSNDHYAIMHYGKIQIVNDISKKKEAGDTHRKEPRGKFT